MLCCGLELSAQRKTKPVGDYIPSENIDRKKDFNKRRNRPKQKNISLIVKNKGDGLLYGNPCMMQETHRMGFEYSVQVKGLPGSLKFFGRLWRNAGVHTKLIFTRGPWWKLTLNKRVEDCRVKSGDLVG